jgi:hypothetical protein
MANVVIDIAAQFTGKNAFKQAETSAQKLEKSVAKLGKQLAGVFAASKIYAFSKASVKAFAADEKAARSLALALANTGNAFAAIEVEKFIADLQRATGVLDDNLRPAFRTLLTATGDVKKSQDALALALDISAGTGKDLSSVSAALARGFTGQTTALSRLGAGLTKATLATGDMDAITQALTDKFSGQALAAAEGYSGSIDRLAVASANAKEIIGKDLLDAMQLIAGKDGIGGATTAMEGFATQIGNAVYGIGVLIAKLKSIPGAGFIADVLTAPTGLLALTSRFGANRKATAAGNPAQSPAQRKAIDKANADALKLAKTKNALSTIENANTKEKLILTAGEKALLELKRMFDITGIQLQAALNGVLTEEERARVLGLKAINDSDGALALQALAALNAAAATNALANVMIAVMDRLSASSSTFYTPQALATAAQNQAYMADQNAPYYGNTPGPSSTFYTPKALELQGESMYNSSPSSSGFYNTINLTVQGSVTTERDLVDAITQGIYNNQAAGIPINYSTVY